MDDRTLLELAAKAAGIEYDVDRSKPHPVSKAFFGLWLVIHCEPYEGQRRYWNPLRDEGDALRLAVRLQMCISVNDDYTSVDCSEGHVAISQAHEGDPYAASRRAIVRAAVEISKRTLK